MYDVLSFIGMGFLFALGFDGYKAFKFCLIEFLEKIVFKIKSKGDKK